MYAYVYIYVYIYIIYREIYTRCCLYICIYIYVYMYHTSTRSKLCEGTTRMAARRIAKAKMAWGYVICS